MKISGPPIELLIDRIIAIPEDFLEKKSKSYDPLNKIYVPAIINDLLLDNGGTPLSYEELLQLSPEKKENKKEKNNYPGLVSILCYIYEDNFFTENKSHSGLIKSFLLSPELIELSKAVDSADDFINDPDRREEICRRALDALNYFPQGENELNSADRLLTLNSVERKKIMVKTAEAQLRAKQIHEAMMQKEAEEAASKMSRE